MFKPIVGVLATAGALLLIERYIPGISVTNFQTALIVSVLWGVIGLTVRPILGILTLPINLITFGLFSFVLNAFLFWGLSSVVPGFSVEGFLPALEGSIILAVVSWVVHILL